MSKKGLIALLAGYVAGSVISSVFSKKKGVDLQKELNKEGLTNEDKFKIILSNFIDTQKNVAESLKQEILSEENKAFFAEKKEELIELIDDFKEEGETILIDLKGKGEKSIKAGVKRVEKLYIEKREELDELLANAPDKAVELKNTLLNVFEDFKNKLEKNKK